MTWLGQFVIMSVMLVFSATFEVVIAKVICDSHAGEANSKAELAAIDAKAGNLDVDEEGEEEELIGGKYSDAVPNSARKLRGWSRVLYLLAFVLMNLIMLSWGIFSCDSTVPCSSSL